MRVALLSLVEHANDDQGARVPRGLLPVGARSLVLHQLDLALALGCERIVCLGEALTPGVIELQRAAEQARAQFHFVRGPRNLSALIRAGDELLVLADGLLAQHDPALALLGNGSSILVLPAEPGVSQGFERIDLNRAWGGAMLVPGALAERLFDLPEDADPVPSLLRIALQARVSEREISEGLVGTGWSLVRSAQEAALREGTLIRRVALGADPFSPAVWLAGQAVAWRGTWLLHRGVRSGAPVFLSLLLVALSVLLAANSWTGAGLGFFAVAVVLLEVGRILRRLEGSAAPRMSGLVPRLRWLFDLPLVMLLALGMHQGLDWQTRLFAPLVALGLARVVPAVSPGRWSSLITDRALFALLAAVAAGAGVFLPALRAYCLALLAFAVMASAGQKR